MGNGKNSCFQRLRSFKRLQHNALTVYFEVKKRAGTSRGSKFKLVLLDYDQGSRHYLE